MLQHSSRYHHLHQQEEAFFPYVKWAPEEGEQRGCKRAAGQEQHCSALSAEVMTQMKEAVERFVHAEVAVETVGLLYWCYL